MADLAVELLRMVVRAYYHTEHILVIDALCFHSTLSDQDLSNAVGMNVKPLRKIAGRLREDGLVSTQTRLERRTDGSGGFFSGSHGHPGKERTTNREWYYINFHRAIDAVKYRLWKLSKHVESQGAPTTEKKDLICPRCKSQFTDLEAMPDFDYNRNEFLCGKCGHALDRVQEDERGSENEHMKRLNAQLEPFLSLMRRIDGTTVPENDFSEALSKHIPVKRDDELNPAPRTEVVDVPNQGLASAKGIDIKPEQISVQLQDDDTFKKDNEAAEARRQREKEARANALPDWISKSTVTGDITTVGAKEELRRREREAHIGDSVGTADVDEKKSVNAADEDVMKDFYAELGKQRAKEAAEAHEDDEEDEDDDDDEDGFEDVNLTGANTSAHGTLASFAASTGVSTPALDSSNATDDEREAKRPRLEGVTPSSSIIQPGPPASSNGAQKATEAGQSDEDEDDDLEFENV